MRTLLNVFKNGVKGKKLPSLLQHILPCKNGSTFIIINSYTFGFENVLNTDSSQLNLILYPDNKL